MVTAYLHTFTRGLIAALKFTVKTLIRVGLHSSCFLSAFASCCAFFLLHENLGAFSSAL